ncbi:MAG: class I SAM-dependent methyltransferase [Bacteroidetes bacterium]|nr:class I SAM-dependent methyltransferase [Fibrella sp.]
MADALHVPFVYEPAEGYNLVAPFIDEAAWTTFWRQNEAPFVDKWIRSLPAGLGLDAGSGTGPYLPVILKAGHSSVAFDNSAEMRARYQLKYNSQFQNCPQPDYRMGSLEAPLPFADQAFDWILCTRVLSHIDNLPELLAEFNRVLRPGGACLISDVHPQHPYNHTGFTIYPDSIAFPDGYKINIQTNKHPVDALLKTSVDTGFAVSVLREFDLTDLQQPPDPSMFKKLYAQPDRKIFYVLQLHKSNH